jgi:hypothetical protein
MHLGCKASTWKSLNGCRLSSVEVDFLGELANGNLEKKKLISFIFKSQKGTYCTLLDVCGCKKIVDKN